MFGAFGGARSATSLTFISKAAEAKGIAARLGLAKRTAAVSNTRRITKADMVLNDYTPFMEVDPETYEVRADGELLTCEAAVVLPLAQRYYLF
jgi:urease subunit alpha